MSGSIYTSAAREVQRARGAVCDLGIGAETGSDLTRGLECHLIDLGKDCSIEAASPLTGLSWDRCWGIMERAVKRGQSRLPWRGQEILRQTPEVRYDRLRSSERRHRIRWRGSQTGEPGGLLPAFYQGRVGSGSGDFHGYVGPLDFSHKAYVPGADTKIVLDKFHVMSYLNEAR